MRTSLYVLAALSAFLPLAACSTAQEAKFQAGADQVAKAAQAVCQVNTADGPAFVALAEINGAPVAATTAAKAILDADCAAIGGILAPAGTPVPAVVAVLPPRPG